MNLNQPLKKSGLTRLRSSNTGYIFGAKTVTNYKDRAIFNRMTKEKSHSDFHGY